MSDRCYSTLICAIQDTSLFEKIGYTIQDAPALSVDEDEILGAAVMTAEEAENGRYDELTALSGVPFIVCNGCCPGSFGDHLIVSDGVQWQYSEALHESSYPAVRVNPTGNVQESEVNEARKYWAVYKGAVRNINRSANGRHMRLQN